MRKALLLTLAMALVVAPFVTHLYITILIFAVILAVAIWAIVHLRRPEPEIDVTQLQCELEGFLHELNREGGK